MCHPLRKRLRVHKRILRLATDWISPGAKHGHGARALLGGQGAGQGFQVQAC